ncbi:MAG: N-acetyltransferase [Rhizobiaceae bacterium]|nr:N-acetyltransferase [Rhizobiaceae bacterium]
MSTTEIVYLPEDPAHDPAIEEINAEAFGPGRYTRAAYRIREGGPHDMALSFVAVTSAGEIVGSVRMTHVSAGAGAALLLGPLAVRPAHKNVGIGRKLVQLAIEAAKEAGQSAVLLVGDAPYYGPLGFATLPHGQILMPGPVDPHRLLGHEMTEGALAALKGPLVHRNLAGRVRA